MRCREYGPRAPLGCCTDVTRALTGRRPGRLHSRCCGRGQSRWQLRPAPCSTWNSEDLNRTQPTLHAVAREDGSNTQHPAPCTAWRARGGGRACSEPLGACACQHFPRRCTRQRAPIITVLEAASFCAALDAVLPSSPQGRPFTWPAQTGRCLARSRPHPLACAPRLGCHTTHP